MACSCAACGTHSHHEHEDGQHAHSLWKRQDIIRFSISALFFVLGIALHAAGDPFRVHCTYGSYDIECMLSSLLFVAAWLSAGLEVLENVVKTAGRSSFFDENFLMTFATLGAFLLGEWTEGAAVMLFYNIGELLQGAAVQQSRRSITNLMDLRPEFVRLYQSTAAHHHEREHEHCECDHHEHEHEHCECDHHEHEHEHCECDHHEHEHEHCECDHHKHEHEHCECDHHADTAEQLVAPETVPIGSLIVVKAGEKVPLDGIVVEGACSFDTQSITGESVPRFVETGGTVLAGFVNLDGLTVIRTTATADNTAAAKMLALVEHAQDHKTKTERLISAFARIYTPIVTIGAVALAVVPPLLLALIYREPLTGWGSFAPWIARGLVFLVISCPCAFVISVPLGYFGGLGGAARKGILIKGATFIDALAHTDSVIFDKTGTLTEGILAVDKLILADAVTRDSLLTAAYKAEYHSNHPVAQAIKRYVEHSLDHQIISRLQKEAGELSNYREKAGQGVAVEDHGALLQAGSPAYIFGNSERIDPHVSAAEGIKVAFACNGRYIGALICSDKLKKDSAQAVQALRKAGVQYIEMLTGDTKQVGEKITQQLALDRCSSELLPHEKVSRFEAISGERKKQHEKAVCVFVGDGINDAPALARADVGIAMGAIGSDAAIEAADIVLMNDNPLLIAEGITSARFTRKIVMQNIILAFSVKIAFLTLGAWGIIGLWAAVFADVGVALLAVCNSLRARR